MACALDKRHRRRFCSESGGITNQRCCIIAYDKEHSILFILSLFSSCVLSFP
jgi:hypothetical protein